MPNGRPNLPMLRPEYQMAQETYSRLLQEQLGKQEEQQRPYLQERLGVSPGAMQAGFAGGREDVMNLIAQNLSNMVLQQVQRQQQVADIESGRKYQTGERRGSQTFQRSMADVGYGQQARESQRQRTFTGEQAGLTREQQAGQFEQQFGLQQERFGWEQQMYQEALERQQEQIAQAERQQKRGFWQSLIPTAIGAAAGGFGGLASLGIPGGWGGAGGGALLGLGGISQLYGQQLGQRMGQRGQMDYSQLMNMYQPQGVGYQQTRNLMGQKRSFLGQGTSGGRLSLYGGR